MTQPGMHTYREITSQDQSWAATLAMLAGRKEELRPWLSQPWEQVVFTGCGSTYYLAQVAAAVWQAQTGQPARGVPGSELWLYPESARVRGIERSLLVAISRSGETSETLRAVEGWRRDVGQDVLDITVYPDRPLQPLARYTLVGENATEESMAQTRSFTTMLLLAEWAASLAAGKTEDLQALQNLPAAGRHILNTAEGVARRLGEDQSLQRFVFLGQGARYGVACEAMLKMKEMSLSASEAFHFLEFRHGPKSVVGRDMLVIGLLSNETRAQELAVLREMHDLGAHTLAIAEAGGDVQADDVVELPRGIPDLVRGPLYLPALQLLAYYRAVSKGLNTDAPANLSAVVIL